MKVLTPIKKEDLGYDNGESIVLYTYENATKEELKAEADRLTYRAEKCGHAHDCCGCFVRQWAEVIGDDTIEITECYNY